MNPAPLTEKERELTTWISEEGPDTDLDLARSAEQLFALNLAQANGIIDKAAAALAGRRLKAQQLGMSETNLAACAAVIRVSAKDRRHAC